MATLGSSVVLFGGNTSNQPMGDTWVFDGTRWTQVMPSLSPSPRYHASMASLGTKVVLFGGTTNFQTVFQHTWTFDGTTWTQVNAPTSPPGRYAASMAVLP